MNIRDIIDLLNPYIQLERIGNSLKGKCPFHNEKTPSFHINPKREFYHCFGCGKGGSLKTLVSEIWEHRDNEENK